MTTSCGHISLLGGAAVVVVVLAVFVALSTIGYFIIERIIRS
jgi:hypothetical protein